MREGAGKWEMMEKWSKGETKDNLEDNGILREFKGSAGDWICLDIRKRRAQGQGGDDKRR